METSNKLSMFRRVALIIMTIVMMAVMADLSGVDASAQTTTNYAPPTFVAESMYDSAATHPYGKQTSQLNVRWNKAKGAYAYELFIKGGKYTKWTSLGVTENTSKLVTGLKRTTSYQFKVKGIGPNQAPVSSSVQTLKTARMDYDADGWQAMCRIVYHEVGQINNDMWDKPIVYVADCVANRYVAAKYTNNYLWKTYYRYYNSVQSMIYNSGGFMSSAGLTYDGATYARVPSKVKQAVYGAVYGKTTYKGIANDYNVYYWCNRSYNSYSSKVAYSFRIPWGYFLVWRSYWG